MKFRSIFLAAAALLLTVVRPAAGADAPLILGVFPNMTAKQIVETYQPLANALEKKLQRRIMVYSARDFRTFVERTRKGEYDILLTAPHLALLARQDAGYRPLLKYARTTHGVLVVKASSPFETPEALHGRAIASADSIALAVMAVQADLAAIGLKRNADYQTVEAGTHLNSVMQVINGRADAAILGMHPFVMLPPELRQQLRVLHESAPLSSLMYLTHPRLRDHQAAAIRSAMLAFAETPEGQSFMQRGGYGGFAAVDGTELRAFLPYTQQAQELLRAPR